MIIIIRRNKKYRRKGRKHFCQNFNYFRNTLSFQLAACFFQSMPTCMWNSIHRTLPVKRIEQGGHKVIIKLHQTWISRDHNNDILVITFLWQNFRYNRWQAINNDNFFDKTCRGYGCHLCKYEETGYQSRYKICPHTWRIHSSTVSRWTFKSMGSSVSDNMAELLGFTQ